MKLLSTLAECKDIFSFEDLFIPLIKINSRDETARLSDEA